MPEPLSAHTWSEARQQAHRQAGHLRPDLGIPSSLRTPPKCWAFSIPGLCSGPGLALLVRPRQMHSLSLAHAPHTGLHPVPGGLPRPRQTHSLSAAHPPTPGPSPGPGRLPQTQQTHSLRSAHPPTPGPSPGPGRLPQTQADALPEFSTCPHTWASPGPGHLPETLQATTKLPVTLSQARKLRF